MKYGIKTHLLLTGSVLILAMGCVKETLYNTPHPDKGAVAVTTHWSGISSDAVRAESYLLRIGSSTQAVSGVTNTFRELLPEGTYSLLVQNMPHGMSVGAQTATVDTLADGTLEPLPEYLFSAVQELEVIRDDTLKAEVKMRQHNRRLTLVLKLTPSDGRHIAGTSATLTGIASAVDLTTGAITSTEGKTVVPVFVLGTENRDRATGQPVLVATLRLLGVQPEEEQVLTLAVTLADGQVQTITSDLTEALRNFSTGAGVEPLTLDATLTLPPRAGMSGSITDWLPGNGGGEDIDIK